MSLLASPIHSFVYLYILLCLHLLSLSIHLSIFIYVLCLHFLSFSLYICLSLHPFMFTLVVFFSMHLYIFIYVSCVHFLSFSLHPFVHLMLTLVFLSPSICCPFEKMKSRSVDERSCPFLSKIKITQNMFLEQKNVLAKFRRMSLRWTRHTDDWPESWQRQTASYYMDSFMHAFVLDGTLVCKDQNINIKEAIDEHVPSMPQHPMVNLMNTLRL